MSASDSDGSRRNSVGGRRTSDGGRRKSRRSNSRSPDDFVFALNVNHMKELMEFRGAEAAAKLEDLYGGAEKLCKRLNTSPTKGMEAISLLLRPGG
jgi:hypothetical protein